MTTVDGQHQQLRATLSDVEKWLDNPPHGLELDDYLRGSGGDIETVRKLLHRAASSLINVAFLGGFSSGKSFLVGGLQERLGYTPVADDEGTVSDRYVGLLYSASRVSTACPATVLPVDGTTDVDVSGHGFFRARFIGSECWEDIGNSPPPAVVAAYTTDDPRVIARGRAPQHRDLVVAEAEIQLGPPAMPAKLYDLPGHGSISEVHDAITNRAWAAADCVVYVVQATQPLSREEIALLTRLNTHHATSGKRVIWVMTAIDRANSLTYEGRHEWEETLEDNNAYLRDHFPPTPGHDDTFVGPVGFMAVSPAWEAQGRWHREHGDPVKGERLIAASRMDRLRRELIHLIDTGTGRKHIVTVAREARTIMATRYRVLAGLLDSARLPLNQLAAERDALGQRMLHLRSAIGVVREQLEAVLGQHLRGAEHAFAGLAEHLHAKLDDQINAAVLTREREANKIEISQPRLAQEWISDSANAPVKAWEAGFHDFTRHALELVRTTLRESEVPDAITEVVGVVDLAALTVSPSSRYRSGPQDVMQKISGFVGLSAPVVASIGLAAGVISGPLLVVPAGVTLVAGLVYGGIHRLKSRSTALDMLRREWIDGLDEVADDYRDSYLASAASRGTEVIDRAVELLSERVDELGRTIILLELRLHDPENADKSALVAQLEPYCRRAERLITELDVLTA